MDIYTNKYNVGATVEGVTLTTFGATDFKSTPTLAAGDVKISKDGGTFTNIASLPAVTPAADTSVQVVLSATEMSAKEIVVRFIDQTGPKEWNDFVFKLRTYGNASAFYPGDLDFLDVSVNSVLTESSSHPTLAEIEATTILAKEANVETHVTNSLNTYDPPTRTEATADKDAIIVQVDANETKIDIVDTNVDTIVGKLPTNYLMGSAVITAKDDEIDSIKTSTDAMFGKLPTNYIMGSTVVTAKDDEIDAIKVKTDQLLFDSYGDVLATQNYVAGAVATDITNGASQFKTTLGSATNDFYTGGWLLITSGTLSGSPPRRITSYDGSTKKVLLSSAFTSTPADGVTFKIFLE